MKVEVKIEIDAPRGKIWTVITDIENAANRISAIEKIEILENPADSLVGLKWKETRTMFGKSATEVMWIVEAVENEFYDVRAESCGTRYSTKFSISEEGNRNTLSVDFSGEPRTFLGKLLAAPMGLIFKGAMENELIRDLSEIKEAIDS